MIQYTLQYKYFQWFCTYKVISISCDFSKIVLFIEQRLVRNSKSAFPQMSIVSLTYGCVIGERKSATVSYMPPNTASGILAEELMTESAVSSQDVIDVSSASGTVDGGGGAHVTDGVHDDDDENSCGTENQVNRDSIRFYYSFHVGSLCLFLFVIGVISMNS